jgi:hypothetical protein
MLVVLKSEGQAIMFFWFGDWDYRKIDYFIIGMANIFFKTDYKYVCW